MSDLSKMISTAHDVNARFDGMLFRAKVRDSGEARVSAILCLTICEQFAAALHLIEGGFCTHALIIVRSMLEGLATLLNLVNDPTYLDQMKFENARSDIILFDEYAVAPDMEENKEAIETLRSWNDKAQPVRDDLKAKGFKPESVTEKFK